MTAPDDTRLREMLAVLDRPADPDPIFAEQLEQRLLDEPASPDRAGSLGRPRRTWLLVAAVLVVTIIGGAVLAAGNNSERTETEPGPADEPTPRTSQTTQAPPPDTEDTAGNTAEDETADQSENATTATASEIPGILPDGTRYTVLFDEQVPTNVTGISGGIVLDGVAQQAIGITNFRRSGGAAPGTSTSGDTVTATFGDWTMVVELYDDVIETIEQDAPAGSDAATIVADAITVAGSNAPYLQVAAPFRWADDASLPLAMEVVYEDFVVRRGCDGTSVACSYRQGVQVIPADQAFAPAPPWDDRAVWIESNAPRRTDDPSWLDVGPLEARGVHEVIWTGAEMIVFGGATGDRPQHLRDGAAFNPQTNQWRQLPAGPFDESAPTGVVWTGTDMLVTSLDTTARYSPDTDDWERVGDGLTAGWLTWTGTDVVALTNLGVFRFDRVDGRWIELPGAFTVPAGTSDYRPDRWSGESLLAVDGVLYLRRGCSTQIRRWVDEAWEPTPSLPREIANSTGYNFCPWANQWAALDGDLILWESEAHPTVAFDPETDTWREIASTPVAGTEGPNGTIVVDDRLLAVGQGAALYDATTNTWTSVRLPGWASPPDMVWTGTEVLMWGGTCCYGSADTTFTNDAWRWTPPDR